MCREGICHGSRVYYKRPDTCESGECVHSGLGAGYQVTIQFK
jgi:hypothetical protein